MFRTQNSLAENYNLIILGGPQENLLTADLLAALPVKVGASGRLILYINTLSRGAMYASAGYSLRTTRTWSLSIDAVCLSHCYKVLSDPIW